jgi:hypothetical protein
MIFRFVCFTEDLFGATIDFELNRKHGIDVAPVEVGEVLIFSRPALSLEALALLQC